MADGGVDGREDPARLVAQLLTGRRQLDAAGGALQQSAAELLLECPDLAAQHGLGDEELLGGAAEVQVLSHRGEVAELAQVEIHTPRVSMVVNRYWTLHGAGPHGGSMIVITTPTGDIGSQVLGTLVERVPAAGEELRVVVRDPARLPDSVRDRVDVVPGSHGDADVVEHAFAGADAVFWLVPPNAQAASLEDAYSGFTQAAAKAFATQGVGHVVGVSALGRGTPVAGRAGLVTASLAMDDLIASTGVAYRALANPSFMDNLLRQVDSIRDHGTFTDTVVAGSEGTGRGDPRHRCGSRGTPARPVVDGRGGGPGARARRTSRRRISPRSCPTCWVDRSATSASRSRTSVRRLGSYGMGAAFVQGMVDMMRAKDEGLDDGVAGPPENARARRPSARGARRCSGRSCWPEPRPGSSTGTLGREDRRVTPPATASAPLHWGEATGPVGAGRHRPRAPP